MQIICTSLQTDNHTRTSPLSFYRPDGLPVAQPTASKHWRQISNMLKQQANWTLSKRRKFVRIVAKTATIAKQRRKNRLSCCCFQQSTASSCWVVRICHRKMNTFNFFWLVERMKNSFDTVTKRRQKRSKERSTCRKNRWTFCCGHVAGVDGASAWAIRRRTR